MQKLYKCNVCKEQHRRPTGARCPFVQNSSTEEPINSSIMNSVDPTLVTPGAQSAGLRDRDILSALEAVSSSLSAIEHRIECTEEKLLATPGQVGSLASPSVSAGATHSNPLDQQHMLDTVVPSVQMLEKKPR